MKLTTREKTSLFFEAVITIILLAMLDLAVITILQDVVRSNPGVAVGIYIIKKSLVFSPTHIRIWS